MSKTMKWVLGLTAAAVVVGGGFILYNKSKGEKKREEITIKKV